MRYPDMKRSLLFGLTLLAVGLLPAWLVQAEPYKDRPGAFQVETYTEDWHDDERDRTVPIRVYLPTDAEGPRPVVLLSHGLGGTRDALSYLGRHWASYGYICVAMQHPGTDDSVWRDERPAERMRAMRRAARQWSPALERANDVPFVLDVLTTLAEHEDSPLHGRLDLEHIAIAGHSFGAWTAMAHAGQGMGARSRTTMRDERIDIAIALSSPVPRNPRNYDASFESVAVPVLHITGTLDESPVNDTTAEQRRVPYEHTPGRDDGGSAQYLIVFEGGDHMVLAGPGFHGEPNPLNRLRQRDGVDTDRDPLIHGLILQAGTAFLDGWLLGDEEALRWLDEGVLEDTIGDEGVVESK